MQKPKSTMIPEEEAAWEEAMQQGRPPPEKGSTIAAQSSRRHRRTWDIEELWEKVSIFNSKGLRDASEFVLSLEKD